MRSFKCLNVTGLPWIGHIEHLNHWIFIPDFVRSGVLGPQMSIMILTLIDYKPNEVNMNLMGRGAWQAAVHGVAKNQIRLSTQPWFYAATSYSKWWVSPAQGFVSFISGRQFLARNLWSNKDWRHKRSCFTAMWHLAVQIKAYFRALTFAVLPHTGTSL